MVCLRGATRINKQMAGNPNSATVLRRRHSELCFQRAFPRTVDERHAAESELDRISESGIAGTTIHYRFSFDVAKWLARRAPGCVSVDWDEVEDCEPLDTLLALLLQPSEDEYFDSGCVTTEEWVNLASASFKGTDFDWLMAQLQKPCLQAAYRQLYDAADIPLMWELRGSRFSTSRNAFPVTRIKTRERGMRPKPGRVKAEIARPVESIARLSEQRGSALVDVAIASLATRHRETYHFNFANSREVYLADVGEGVSIAVFGLLAEHRFPLECTMGYLILSNGVPIGYGGSSLLFKQANTGVNIFDEYRGSEAAYLWVQVMRVYHSLVGCTRFIANQYQLGGDNSEALRSGAFWFYYRLGYRPVEADVRDLALAEHRKARKRTGYRSNLKTLRRLSSCDMHLTLPAAKQSEFFDEEWLATSSGLATVVLGCAGGTTRNVAAERVARRLMKDLGVTSLQSWTREERRGLVAIAPFVAALQPSTWSNKEKRNVRKLVQAKGGPRELAYAKLMAADRHVLSNLRARCRQD